MKRPPGSRRSAATMRLERASPKKRVDALEQLEQAELVRRVHEPELAYIFKHTLTQETAYQSLLNRTRREIHLEVARVYEDLFPHHLDENAALLAQHYAEGGDDAKAFEYATRAGETATRMYANAEAIGYYTRAIELATRLPVDGPQLTRLYLQRGRVQELKGEYESALANYRALHELAEARGERAMALASLMATLPIYATPTSAHDPVKAKELAERALALARKLGDRAAESKILWSLMIFTRWSGEPLKAVEYGEGSLKIAQEEDLREQIAFTLNDMAVHGYLDAGKYQQALESVKRAQVMWIDQKNIPMLADSLGGIALVSYTLGKYDESIQASDEAHQISRSIGNLWGQSFARWVTGNIYSDRGEPAHAAQIMEECIRLGEQAGFLGAEVGVQNMLAALYLEYGSTQRALEIATRAVELSQRRLVAWAPWAEAVHARVLVRFQRFAEARDEIKQVRRRFNPGFMGRAMGWIALHLMLAESEMTLMNHEPGFNAGDVNGLTEFLAASNGRALLPEVLLIQARLFLIRDENAAASASLGRAREIAEPLMHRRLLWRIYGAQAEIELRDGHADAAEKFRAKAREMVVYIAAHANAEQRAAFLNLADLNGLGL